MYRSYEDPYELECKLEEAEANLKKAQEVGLDVEIIISLFEDVADLKERVNFAWQDDEYS